MSGVCVWCFVELDDPKRFVCTECGEIQLDKATDAVFGDKQEADEEDDTDIDIE